MGRPADVRPMTVSYLHIPDVQPEQRHVPPPAPPSRRSAPDTWPADETRRDRTDVVGVRRNSVSCRQVVLRQHRLDEGADVRERKRLANERSRVRMLSYIF